MSPLPPPLAAALGHVAHSSPWWARALRCFTPPRGIDEVVADLERILAVLSLDIPAVRTVATTLLLDGKRDDAFRRARDELFAAWRAAGLSGIPGPGASS